MSEASLPPVEAQPSSVDAQLPALLCEVLFDAIDSSLDALERAGAIDLTRLRKAWAGPGSKHHDLVLEQIRSRIIHLAPFIAGLARQRRRFDLIGGMTAAYNNSLAELEARRIVDTRALRRQYRGVGSLYYDVVTEQMEAANRRGLPRICALFGYDYREVAMARPSGTVIEPTGRIVIAFDPGAKRIE